MTKDTVIGVGLGLLVGWLLWRRRGLLGLAAGFGASSGGGCGCSGSGGSLAALGGSPNSRCARAFGAGTGDYRQGQGFTLQGAP